jgi:streptomycin 6-kinase
VDVRARLDAAARAWGLDDVAPLPDGHVALVCAATRAGRPVVVKVQPRGERVHPALTAEGDALAFWQPTGAVVPLLGRRDGGTTLLLARLRPGAAASALPPHQRLAVLGGLAWRLHAAGAPPATIPEVAARTAGWRPALAAEPGALAELDRLEATSGAPVLLHGDLHGGNALDDGGTWRVIDPHGLRGDPHFEVWALMEPAAPALPPAPRDAAAEAADRLRRYCAAARLDPGRAARWLRLRALAEALAVERAGPARGADAAWAARLRRLAAALAP